MDFKLVPLDTVDVVALDWLQNPLTGLIEEDDGLRSAVIIALCTDAEASSSDILPDPNSTDLRGWWGDYQADVIWGGWPVGSKLWLLTRAKILGAGASEGATVSRVISYITTAMQPFVAAKLFTKFTVSAVVRSVEAIDATIIIYRGNKPAVELRFQALWSAQTIMRRQVMGAGPDPNAIVTQSGLTIITQGGEPFIVQP